MAYCGIEGTMYGKVEACNFLCHPYAQKLITLTVEVGHSPARLQRSPACDLC